MRKSWLFVATLLIIQNFAAQPLSFAITNLTGNDTLTCNITSINLMLSSN